LKKNPKKEKFKSKSRQKNGNFICALNCVDGRIDIALDNHHIPS
jgi:hypothetical protein